MFFCKNARISSCTYPCKAKGEDREKEEGNQHKKDSLVQPKKDDVVSVPASSSSFPYSSPKGKNKMIAAFEMITNEFKAIFDISYIYFLLFHSNLPLLQRAHHQSQQRLQQLVLLLLGRTFP